MSSLITLNREEGSHWYTPDGKPCHEVPKKKGGGTRKTTIRDARDMGLLPSPTSVLKQSAKPQLEKWIQVQVAEAVVKTKPLPEELSPTGELDAARFIKRVLVEREQQNDERTLAAELGTAIHARIAEILTHG